MRRTKKFATTRWLSTLFASTLALGVLAACGGNSSDSGKSAGSGGTLTAAQLDQATAIVKAAMAVPTTITQDEPLPKAPPTGKHLIYLDIGVPATVPLLAGIKEAAAAVGWTVSTLAVNPADPASLQAGLNTALAQKPDFVSETGLPQSLFGQSIIDAYKAAGIPIIITSVAPFDPGGPILAGNPDGPAAQVPVGKAIAAWFAADSKGSGNALLESATSYPVLKVFADSFNTELSQLCPDCKTKTLEVTADQAAKGQINSAIVAQLRSNPDIKYVIIDNAEFVPGLPAALKTAGLSGIKIAGRSLDAASAQGLKDGTEQAWTGTPYPVIGMSVIDIAARYALGVGGAEKDEVHPFQMFTSDNVDSAALPYNQPADALDQYKKLWQVQ